MLIKKTKCNEKLFQTKSFVRIIYLPYQGRRERMAGRGRGAGGRRQPPFPAAKKVFPRKA